MRSIFTFLLIGTILAGAALLTGFSHPQHQGLRVYVDNIRQTGGSVYIAVYDRENDFLDYNRMRDRRIVPVTQAGRIEVDFQNLSDGYYAISCFHDVNGNGKIDTNLFGIPTEPYGFSNNVRPKFRAPNWSEAVFMKKGVGQSEWIQLKKW